MFTFFRCRLRLNGDNPFILRLENIFEDFYREIHRSTNSEELRYYFDKSRYLTVALIITFKWTLFSSLIHSALACREIDRSCVWCANADSIDMSNSVCVRSQSTRYLLNVLVLHCLLYHWYLHVPLIHHFQINLVRWTSGIGSIYSRAMSIFINEACRIVQMFMWRSCAVFF